MNERGTVLLLVSIFLVAGIALFFYTAQNTEFNFYQSQLTYEEGGIQETLTFSPDKKYHTLFRDFENEANYRSYAEFKNSIEIVNVSCSDGTAYFRPKNRHCILFQEIPEESYCPSYTENNEYGCTFGGTYGFFEGNEYTVEATFIPHATTLFFIEGNYYLKFVAYSKDRHPPLDENNFITSSSIVRKEKYSPAEEVVVYLPYDQPLANKQIISQKSFTYGSSLSKKLLTLIFYLLPAAFIFFTWRLFGKENISVDVPPELSMYPNERKPWEVAAFFQPPFNMLDKNFISTMILSFYQRKIIDLKVKDKDPYLKILLPNTQLDPIEDSFLNILKALTEKDALKARNYAESSLNKSLNNFFFSSSRPKDYFDGEYLNLKKAFKSASNRTYLITAFKTLRKDVKDEGKKYLDTRGRTFVLGAVIALYFLSQTFFAPFFISMTNAVYLYFALIVVLLVFSRNALFLKFKKSYYSEFMHWQSYRKFLKNSFSIKAHGHKGVILWEKILVYATALGVAKEVLKELEEAKIIAHRNVAIYSSVYVSSSHFSAASGRSGGGVGGGGVGGGGGGGR